MTWTRRSWSMCCSEIVNLSPRGIREHLHLNRPIYAADLAPMAISAATPDQEKGTFTWERTDSWYPR